MSDKYGVVWTRQQNPAIRLLCVDEETLSDTMDGAKQAGRDMLPALKKSDFLPLQVMRIDEDKIEELLTGEGELHTVDHADGENEVTFVQLAP